MMNVMTRGVFILACALILVACEEKSQNEPAATPQPPTKKQVKGEVQQGVKDVLDKRGPKWTVAYSGDLSGSVEGGILTSVSMKLGRPTTTVVGAAMAKDMKGKANQSLRINIIGEGDASGGMKLTLDDGTVCTEANPKKLSKVKILDPDDKKFRAEISGNLACGEAKKQISYTAKLNKAP